ncbi:ABC transporter ATP-binding protein [candidate division WOR-3 bacterium]|nr:ABC transporter ATP-binding protein [candidate division WOR-3 bacterium]
MLIKLEGVKKDYPLGKTTVHALKNISLSIEEGEFSVIAGPSGSGKTTLLNLMGLLDHPTEGKILFEGTDVSKISDSDATRLRKTRIGFIFQTFNLIPVLTALENVELPLILKGVHSRERRKTALKIMEEAGISDIAKHRPDELSGGQRQRVAIARALVGNPDVVFADEPTANLDSETGEQIIRLMEELNRIEEVTFVFSTHDVRIISLAKRKVGLRDGEIVSDVT